MQYETSISSENSEYIRPLTRTRDDFDRLARCYNSFKDPESWPGGFGGTRVFTGEFIEKGMKEQNLDGHFVVIAPDDPDRIVGVCFIGKSWNSPNSYYVQLLGVDPAYQGQKFGKALLLQATSYVSELNANMISLHTWGGNLKAMPLYKRQGYKWRPNTSVFMESYLPQILKFPYFQEFFSTLSKSWYEAFSPIIDQEPNDLLLEQMQIYEYCFEDENQSLTVWVDRAIGKIAGFHIKAQNKDLLIRGLTRDSKAFIGSEEFTSSLLVTNKSKTDLIMNFEIDHSSKIQVLDPKKRNSITLSKNQSKTFEIQGVFLADTDELDTKVHTHTLTDHGIIFNITTENRIIPLTVGKIPGKAVKVDSDPVNFVVRPDSTFSIPLSLQNNVGEESVVILEVKDSQRIAFSEHKKEVILSKYDSQVEFNAKTSTTPSSVDYIEVTVNTMDGKLLTEEKIPVIIFNESKSLSYKSNQQIYIENKNLRISIYEQPHPGSNEVFVTDKLRKLQVFGLPIVLGYPFDVEGTEFYTKHHEHQILDNEAGICLSSTAKSDLKPGIEVTRKIFLSDDSNSLSVQWEVKNSSEKKYNKLGVVNHTYWWPSTIQLQNRILPLKSGIRQLDLTAFPVDLGNDPTLFQEGWQAAEYSTGAFGILFKLDSIDKITIGRAQPNIDIKISDLASGEQVQTEPIFLTFADSWQAIRKEWKDKYAPSPRNEVEYSKTAASLKQIGLRNSFEGKTIAHGLFVDHKNKSLEIAIDTHRETTFKGSLALEFDSIDRKIKTNLPEVKKHTFEYPFTLDFLKGELLLKGKLSFDSLTRIFEYPITLGMYNSAGNISVEKNEKENAFIINNGFLTFKGSEKYRGSVYHLSINENTNNLLHYGITPYPQIGPFLWYNQFYGGIGPILQPEGERDIENFNKLSYESYHPSAGKWKGIGFKSDIIDYSPKLKGLQIATEYVTLPNSPFLLVQTHVYNHSQIIRKFSLQIEGKMETSKSSQDMYYLEDEKAPQKFLKYKLQDWESTVWLERDPQPKWSAYKREENDYYIAAVIPTLNKNEFAYPYAPNLKIIMLDLITNSEQILPGQMLTYRLLFFLTKELDTIAPFTRSNLTDLLPNNQIFP